MNTDASMATPPPPPPAAPPARPGFSSSDKALVILSHLSALIGVAFLLPLIVWLVKKDDADKTVSAHAKEALNFHISLLIYSICAVPLMFLGVGFLVFFAVWIGGIVLAILAAVKAADGGFYRYPLTIRLVS